MACYFTNQVPAQLDGLRLWSETTAYKNDVCLFLVSVDGSMWLSCERETPDTLSTRSTCLAQEAWKVDVVFLHEPGAGAACYWKENTAYQNDLHLLTGSCSVLIEELLVEVPTNVFQDRIQQRTLEQISDTPVPLVVEELVEVFTVSPRIGFNIVLWS